MIADETGTCTNTLQTRVVYDIELAPRRLCRSYGQQENFPSRTPRCDFEDRGARALAKTNRTNTRAASTTPGLCGYTPTILIHARTLPAGKARPSGRLETRHQPTTTQEGQCLTTTRTRRGREYPALPTYSLDNPFKLPNLFGLMAGMLDMFLACEPSGYDSLCS